jgi:putative flippase GtrA
VLSRQITRYLITGGLGTASHILVLVLSVEYAHLGIVSASIAGFLTALSVSYVLNYYWTFASDRTRFESFWRYFAVAVTGLLLNTSMVFALVKYLGWWYLTAQLTVLFIVPVISFFLNKYWSFASKLDQSV